MRLFETFESSEESESGQWWIRELNGVRGTRTALGPYKNQSIVDALSEMLEIMEVLDEDMIDV